MKTIQKISLAFLILFSIAIKSNAQNQIEIVIVGSSHDNSNSTQNFQAIVDKLKNFKPDMVFGEYLPETDYAKLEESHWAKKAFKNKVDYMNKLNPKTPANLSSLIKRNQKALVSFAYYHKTRMNLALEYAKSWDRGNFDYQMFVLENNMKSKFGREEQAEYVKMFGSSDSLKKIGIVKPSSEYSKIFFPLIYQLGQNQIYKMDCQTYDKPWGQAWGKMDSLYKTMLAKGKADSTSDEAKTVKAMDLYWNFTPEESKAFNADPYAGMNSKKYGELDEAWNLYGGRHFYGYPGFPTEALKGMVAQWVLRNEGMCKNIIDQAQAKNAKRIVVGVGASHRIWMEEILTKNPNVKIINYNDLH
ncbi:DUF5694 domain-containing protein [Pedobacter fastidiosus]|uniref:Haem-binding uptake Tiki superfamily ChaN domain-containing protein n=1 Tax=Pedobacter fastidiosus TaxID=2765361 RepID=A0ABR7KL88_9SPHI|nr:DUF5694 domain-containing protein [Pedobacter fastidiosus]MBC6108843.1 hypothetical protein [Pedobacter fastidiosus]